MSKFLVAASAVAAATVMALTGCGGGGGSAPSQVTLHVIVSEAGVCGQVVPPSMAASAVVDIVSPSGTELDQVKVSQVTGSKTAKCRIPFAVRLPHERLYGVKVEGGTGGTVWVHPSQASHVVVNGTL